MKYLFLAIFSFCLQQLAAQPGTVMNDERAKERSLESAFSAVDVSDGITLFLSNGQEVRLAASVSDPDQEDKLRTEVKEGVLKIYFKREGLKMPRNHKLSIKVYLSTSQINRLTASAGASVKLPAAYKAEALDVKLSSGASMEGELRASNLTVHQNSGAVSRLSGKSEKLTLDLSSGAMFRGAGFQALRADIEASSGAVIKVSIEEELNAKATSGASVQYGGKGVIKDIKVNSGGSVKRLQSEND